MEQLLLISDFEILEDFENCQKRPKMAKLSELRKTLSYVKKPKFVFDCKSSDKSWQVH